AVAAVAGRTIVDDAVVVAAEQIDAVAGVALHDVARHLDVLRAGHGDAVEGAVVLDLVARDLDAARVAHEDAGEAVVVRDLVSFDLVFVTAPRDEALLHEDAGVVAADLVPLGLGVADLEEEDAGGGGGRVAAAGDRAVDVVAADRVVFDLRGGPAA